MEDKWLRLPINFDVERLKADLQTIDVNGYEWIDHVNTRIYEGHWQAVSLRSVGGLVDMIDLGSDLDSRIWLTQKIDLGSDLESSVA